MNDAGQFYTNRVLKDWKEKDKKHVDWCKTWIQTLSELQVCLCLSYEFPTTNIYIIFKVFIKQYHTTGLVWSGTKKIVATGAPPPPPPGCPPPPAFTDIPASLLDPNQDRSALFAQINQGENITRSIMKIIFNVAKNIDIIYLII